jgi:hypothetical protein
MKPGIWILLGNTQLTKEPAALGQRRAFYLIGENSKQSGDVSASATTDAIWLAAN